MQQKKGRGLWGNELHRRPYGINDGFNLPRHESAYMMVVDFEPDVGLVSQPRETAKVTEPFALITAEGFVAVW